MSIDIIEFNSRKADSLRQAQLESALRESEQRLQLLADNLPHAMVYQVTALPDGSRRFTYVSRGVERLNELTVEAVLADASLIYNQMLPEYLPMVREKEEIALQTLTTLRVEVQSQLPSGRLRWFEYASTPRYLSDGMLVWDGVEVDITDRKHNEEELEHRVADRTAALTAANWQLESEIRERIRVQEELEESRHLLIEAQQLSHIGSWQWNMEQDVAQWSEEMFAILGFPPGAAIPNYEQTLMMFTEESRIRAADAVAHVLQTGCAHEVAVDFVRGDGDVRNLIVRGRPRQNSAGIISHLFGTVQDVTEWKEAEQERQNLLMQVQHAQKLESLGVLAGGIAHDFNNILHLILGNVHHVQQLVPEISPACAFVNNIERAVNRAAVLTRQMLAYCGKGCSSVQALDLSELVQEMVHLVQASISRKTTLQLSTVSPLPAINADAAQIQQVAMNLILNAAEALDEEKGGKVDIAVKSVYCEEADLRGNRIFEAAEPGAYVCLEVADNGCGMDATTQERLFDPFYTTKFTGRGLGMSAVLGIVRSHKGAILVDSAPGAGARIRVLFPASELPLPKPNPDSTTSSGVVGKGADAVLFVDDEPDMLELAAMVLEQKGFTVFTAGDGQDALEVFSSHRDEIGCVLLDLCMPRLDGVETLRELHRIDPHLPVLLASGYAEQELQTRLADQTVTAMIEKPYDFRTLSQLLHDILSQRRTQTTDAS